MAEVSYNSKFYADDKDIYDLISFGHFPTRYINKWLASKGIIISKELTDQELAEEICKYCLSWNDFKYLLQRVDAPNKLKKRKVVKANSLITKTDFTEKLEELARDYSGSDKLSIIRDPEGNFKIFYKYTVINNKLSRSIQSYEEETRLDIQFDGDTFDFTYDDNHKAEVLVTQILQYAIPGDDIDENVQKVDISGIDTHTGRTKFFLELMQQIDDFELRDVTDLKFDRFSPEDSGDDDEMGEESEELESMVKKAALSGTNLLTAELYSKLKETGFFISKSTWRSTYEVDRSSIAEFRAEFGDGVAGTDFKYCVNRVWDRDENGLPMKTGRKPTNEELATFGGKLYSAAYSASLVVKSKEQD
ncbi:MAG: hypothetical protein AAGH72_09340 [Verrucomicrobiota bacterium]